ncbi:hypothetical protein [Acetobacter aceti]|uniref:hypothetical protein n=1 Tax=Acetobacter aceti TaxID=435 RepID=UPI0011EA566D|nr:hypothetical protein [Acetobacter aceti]
MEKFATEKQFLSLAAQVASLTSGLELAITSIVHFYAATGGPSTEQVAKHLQKTADGLQKELSTAIGPTLERIADGLMRNSPLARPSSDQL